MNVQNPFLGEVDRFFIHSAFHAEGIVPMENIGMDVNKALKSLPADQQRKMRRKFRKLWRKLHKKEAAKRPKDSYFKTGFEAGSKSPSRRAKTMRKQAVYDALLKEKVQPVLANLTKKP